MFDFLSTNEHVLRSITSKIAESENIFKHTDGNEEILEQFYL